MKKKRVKENKKTRTNHTTHKHTNTQPALHNEHLPLSPTIIGQAFQIEIEQHRKEELIPPI